MSSSGTYCVQRKQVPMDRRPRMLKDFLLDDSNSCSSSGFKSSPRKACDSSIQTLIEIDLNARNASSSNTIQLLRKRSKAASTTFSTFQAMINAVKNIPFTAVKSNSILPISLSRRLSSKQSRRREGENKENEAKFKVTIKDIIRWQSFQGLVDEKFSPSDLASSPHHCTTTTTTTTESTASTTTCNSYGSSWCDGDFTSEYLPSWSGKKNLPFVDEYISTEATGEIRTTCFSVGPKGEENQQYSPVSVIDFEFEEEDEESSLSFDQCLSSLERTRQKFIQTFGGFDGLAQRDSVNLEKWMYLITSPENDENEEEEEEGKETPTSYGGEDDNKEEDSNEIEEKAWQLLNHVRATSSMGRSCKNNNVDQVLLDFFRHELSASKRYEKQNREFDSDEIFINRAKDWINHEEDKQYINGWVVGHKKEACVRDMDKDGRWSKFGQEQEELVLEIKNGVLDFLIDELLFILIS